MTAFQLVTIVGSSLTLILLVVIVFELWPAQRTDIFRQEMFELRDELFDFAAQGQIGFDDPAYTLLRQLMNGFIRYAHNLTPFRVLFSFLRRRLLSTPPTEDWSALWKAALEKIPDGDQRNKMEEFHSKTTNLVTGQLILSPGLVLTLIIPLMAVVLLATQIINLKNFYRQIIYRIPVDFLQEEATSSIGSAG